MTDNMKIWNTVKRPPPEALKEIKGGRLSGMTDIKPQWRYQAMTELFGACGTGWNFNIEKVWTEQGSDGQVLAFAKIHLMYKNGDSWSQPIPGIGGSMLVTKESKGLHSSDEGYKMAVTDALSTAMKVLGVGADIYSGMWDGAKYREVQTPKAIITNEVKNQVHSQSLACLENADDLGLKQIWDEFDADQKVVLWGMFNSQERSAMKKLMGAG